MITVLETMWNQRNLSAPPLVTLESPLTAREMPETRKCLEEARKCLSVDTLGPPAARISRIIVRMSNQFRSTVGFKSLRKLNIALLRAKEVKMFNCVDNIVACFPTYLGGIQRAAELPTRQYFEYTLMKMIGFAKILHRVVLMAKETAGFFLATMNRGHFIELSTIVLATVAEVWKCCKNLCKNTVLMYNKMIGIRQQFTRTEHNFMKGFSFPLRLDQWLGSQWNDILEEEEAPFTSRKTKKSLPNFSDEEDIAEEVTNLPSTLERLEPVIMEVEEEAGVVIDRRTLSTHTQHSVMDRQSLLKFLQNENKFREKKDPKSLTVSVPAKKWLKFRHKLEEASRTKSKPDLLIIFNAKWSKLMKK